MFLVASKSKKEVWYLVASMEHAPLLAVLVACCAGSAWHIGQVVLARPVISTYNAPLVFVSEWVEGDVVTP